MFCYRFFDKAIYQLDKEAEQADHFPKWFMTALSAFGLGFQLLIISVMLCRVGRRGLFHSLLAIQF